MYILLKIQTPVELSPSYGAYLQPQQLIPEVIYSTLNNVFFSLEF